MSALQRAVGGSRHSCGRGKCRYSIWEVTRVETAGVRRAPRQKWVNEDCTLAAPYACQPSRVKASTISGRYRLTCCRSLSRSASDNSA